MRPFARFSAVLICVICGVIFLLGTARAETVDRIVANVNGEIILYSELQAQLKLLEKMIPESDLKDPQKKPAIEREVLTQMIRQKLTEQEIKRAKVNVTNSEVDTTLQGIMEENHASQAQFERMLATNGQTLDKFKEQIKKDLERNHLMERVLKSKVVITDQQVEAYLKGEKGDSAATSKKFHLGLILLPVGEKAEKAEEAQKTGNEVLEKLRNGADFRQIAKQYSKGPAAQEGGDIGYMSAEDIAPFIAEGIKNLKKEETSGLVKGPGGYYILKVFDINRQVQNKSDPALREKVRKSLYEQEVNRKFEEWLRNLESKAFIQTSL